MADENTGGEKELKVRVSGDEHAFVQWLAERNRANLNGAVRQVLTRAKRYFEERSVYPPAPDDPGSPSLPVLTITITRELDGKLRYSWPRAFSPELRDDMGSALKRHRPELERLLPIADLPPSPPSAETAGAAQAGDAEALVPPQAGEEA